MEIDAEYLEVLAGKMELVPSRGGALFQNIQSGGRQSLTHLSKPTMRSTLKASHCHSSPAYSNWLSGLSDALASSPVPEQSDGEQTLPGQPDGAFSASKIVDLCQELPQRRQTASSS